MWACLFVWGGRGEGRACIKSWFLVIFRCRIYRAQAAPGDAILLHPPQCCTEMIIFTKNNLNDQPLGSSGFQMFNLKGMRKDLAEIQKVVREREELL